MMGFDMVIIKTRMCDKDLFVCVIYRPPNVSMNDSYLMCETLRSLYDKEILILGDFNLPGIDWTSYDTISNCSKVHECELFIDVVNDLFLHQHVYEPTRISDSGGGSIVDLIFSKDESLVCNLRLNPPLHASDHKVLIFEYRAPLYVKQSNIVYLYNKTNDEEVSEIVEKWKSKFTLTSSIEYLWNNFMLMYESIFLCVPRKRVVMRRGGVYLNNHMFRETVKEKKRAWLIYYNYPSSSTWDNYKQARNRVAKLSIELRRNYEDRLSQNLTSPKAIKKFFHYAKQQGLNTHKKISLVGENSEVLSEDQSARVFSEYFASVYSEPTQSGAYEANVVN